MTTTAVNMIAELPRNIIATRFPILFLGGLMRRARSRTMPDTEPEDTDGVLTRAGEMALIGWKRGQKFERNC